MKKKFFVLLLLAISQVCLAQFKLSLENAVRVAYDRAEEQMVHTALDLLARDCQTVFSVSLQQDNKEGSIIVGTVGKSPLLNGYAGEVAVLKSKKQAFMLKVLPSGKLLIAGSDKHGTAYGIMELSRLIGVSPWECKGGETMRVKVRSV